MSESGRSPDDFPERLDQFVAERCERAFDATLPSNQNMVRAGQAERWQEFAGERAQAPFHPVANDGIADLARDREADPKHFVSVTAWADEQNEAGHRSTPTRIGEEEIGAPGERRREN